MKILKDKLKTIIDFMDEKIYVIWKDFHRSDYNYFYQDRKVWYTNQARQNPERSSYTVESFFRDNMRLHVWGQHITMRERL